MLPSVTQMVPARAADAAIAASKQAAIDPAATNPLDLSAPRVISLYMQVSITVKV
jgi:hypothetical protein